jgi:predicted nucleic acid-binding protein
VLVEFDATVLCGALVNPYSKNAQLLELAADGILPAFATDVVGYEFVYNALKGNLTKKRDPFTAEEVEAFVDSFGELFQPENVRRVSVGRDLTNLFWAHQKPVGQVLYELTGRTHDALLDDLHQQQVLAIEDFDPTDLHLLVAAIEHGATHVCTMNRTDLKQDRYGPVEIIEPLPLLLAYS